jgi:hypothetical protein
MRPPYDWPMDDDFSNDRWAIHDSVFHDRLNDTMDHRPFHDRLDDLSFYHATLNDRTNDVLLDSPMLHPRLVKVIFDLDPASSRSIAEVIIVIVRDVAPPKLRGSRRGGRNRSAGVSDCGNAAYSECLGKTS